MAINAFDQASANPTSPWQGRVPGAGPDRVWGYAGFWWRALAHVIDGFVLFAAQLAIGRVVGGPRFGISNDTSMPDQGGIQNAAYMMRPEALQTWPHGHWHVTGPGVADLLTFLVPLLYFTLLESSRWQATVGKRVCHLRVTGLDGQRITYWRALGRYAGKIVSYLTFCIGFMMAGWTTRKQALHDLMAETLVVRLRRPNDLVQFRPPPG